MGWSALAHRVLGRTRPLNIMLALTDRCTARCSYCRITERKSPEMTTEQIRLLLDQAYEFGCRRLGLWGGEPLLREDLGEIVRHAKRLGLFVTVDTNAHLLDRHDQSLLDVDHLNISLDGNQEAHDDSRGTGTFEKTMNGIKHAAGRYRFWTITVLNRNNLDQVDWLLDAANKYGFMTTFQVLHHNEHLGDGQDLRPADDEIRRIMKYLLERKNSGAPIASSRKYLRHMIEWPNYQDVRAMKSGARRCLAGRLYCNVDVNGDLYPCSLLIGDQKPPNAVEMGFSRAFKALPEIDCNACVAACFTEYNLLYGLDIATGLNWIKALRK